MHLKPDPDAVEFLRQFGLMFVFVIYGAFHFVGYASLWPRSRQKQHNDNPKTMSEGWLANGNSRLSGWQVIDVALRP